MDVLTDLEQLYSNYIPKTTTEFWGLTKSLVKNIFTTMNNFGGQE